MKKQSTEIIGTREVIKAIKNGVVKKVLIASNCPEFIIKQFENMKSGVVIEKFAGDQSQLGTKVGKPFPIAVVGYTE